MWSVEWDFGLCVGEGCCVCERLRSEVCCVKPVDGACGAASWSVTLELRLLRALTCCSESSCGDSRLAELLLKSGVGCGGLALWLLSLGVRKMKSNCL